MDLHPLCHFFTSFLCRNCRNNASSSITFDYFHKRIDQIWIENTELIGKKRKTSSQQNILRYLAKGRLREKHLKKRKKTKERFIDQVLDLDSYALQSTEVVVQRYSA